MTDYPWPKVTPPHPDAVYDFARTPTTSKDAEPLSDDELATLAAKWADPPWYQGDDYARLADEASVAILALIAEIRGLRSTSPAYEEAI